MLPSFELFGVTLTQNERSFRSNGILLYDDLIVGPVDPLNNRNIANLINPAYLDSLFTGPRGEVLNIPLVSQFYLIDSPYLLTSDSWPLLGLQVPPETPYHGGIKCPGKFQGENLIIITDGRNGSAGYFVPSQLRGRATLVLEQA